MNLASQISKASTMNIVIRAGRGESVSFTDEARQWLKDRIESVTPSALCERLGFSIIEAHRLIKRLKGEGLLGETIKCTRRIGGKEWAYSWA